MAYRCGDCFEIFDEPREKHTTCESYYGVSGLFSSYNSLILEVCPYCGSEDIEEFDEEDEEEEEEEDE